MYVIYVCVDIHVCACVYVYVLPYKDLEENQILLFG